MVLPSCNLCMRSQFLSKTKYGGTYLKKKKKTDSILCSMNLDTGLSFQFLKLMPVQCKKKKKKKKKSLSTFIASHSYFCFVVRFKVENR